MTRNEFLELIKKKNVPQNSICFDNLEGKDDVFFLRNNYGTWELSYVERGNENFLKRFSNESDALDALLRKLRIKDL